MSHATSTEPVHYVTVTAPDGQVMGYVWGGSGDVGWLDRKASSADAYRAGLEWYEAHVRPARERGLAPLDVLELLSREPGVGPVTAAPDMAAAEELAKAVTPADDARLVAALNRDDADAWRAFTDAFDALTDEDRVVQWGGGEKGPSGAIQMPFPRYSKALMRAVATFEGIGALTNEYRWAANPLPELPPDGRLSTADAIRAAMALSLGERVSEGMIDGALKSGLLDAAVASLRAWYAAEAGRPPQETVPPDHRAPQHTARPLPHDDSGIAITTPPPPGQPGQSDQPAQPQPVPQPAAAPVPQAASNPYAQQAAAAQAPQGVPQQGQQQPYGYPQQGQSPYGYPQPGQDQQPYGYPQQGGQPYGAPQQAPYGVPQQGGQPPYGQPQHPPYGQPQQVAYGGQPQPGQEMCRFCGGRPAVRVTFRAHQGFLILMRFQKYDGPMCGNCGLAVYRTLMTATLCQGWWSPFSLFIFTPFTIIWNLIARGKVSKLPHPAPGQHGQQADPGKPVHQRPLAYVALIPVLWICFLIFQGLSQS